MTKVIFKTSDIYSNILDSSTGEVVSYLETSVFADGTPMDDSKCDGVIFKKLVDGTYIRKAINKNEVLQKTLDNIRSSSNAEVEVYNYISSKDSEQEIMWKFDPADTTSVDDGINIIVTNTGKRLKRVSSVNIGDYHNDSDIDYIDSPNLLDPANVLPNTGIFSGGAGANYPTPSAGYICVNNPIPVEPGEHYTKSFQTYDAPIFGYDVNGVFVGVITPVKTTTARTIFIDTTSTIRGVRFVIAVIEGTWSRVNTCQFVKGQVLPPLTIPYRGVSKFELKEKEFTDNDYTPNGTEETEPTIEGFVQSYSLDKQAFINGVFKGLERTPANIGFHSFSFGDRAVALKDYGVAFGKYTSAGRYAFTAGIDNNAEGDGSFAGGMRNAASEGAATTFGKQSNATGDGAFAVGENARANKRRAANFGYNTLSIAEAAFTANDSNTTESYAGATFGKGNINRSARCFVAGSYNDPILTEPDIEDSETPDKPLFIIGNGTDGRNRKNAAVLYANGDFNLEAIVLKSPNGSKYRISVDDSGTLTTTLIS